MLVMGWIIRTLLAFKASVPHVTEVSIGFAIVARALFVGFERAVKEMLHVVKGP